MLILDIWIIFSPSSPHRLLNKKNVPFNIAEAQQVLHFIALQKFHQDFTEILHRDGPRVVHVEATEGHLRISWCPFRFTCWFLFYKSELLRCGFSWFKCLKFTFFNFPFSPTLCHIDNSTSKPSANDRAAKSEMLLLWRPGFSKKWGKNTSKSRCQAAMAAKNSW